jgi:hypothetical protein
MSDLLLWFSTVPWYMSVASNFPQNSLFSRYKYFYTSPDADFASVPNLLTKVTPVRGTYLPNPPSIFADGDGDAVNRGLLGATARFSMPVVDPMILSGLLAWSPNKE